MNRGLLIAFEGIDGCGKSTQVGRLAERLHRAGRNVTTTSEPTAGPTGQKIRERAQAEDWLDPEEQLRWFVEDRRVHVAEVIRPALEAGDLVLTDRYFLSTVAYQGAKGLDPQKILSDSEAEFPIPDLVLLFEVDPGPALKRVHARGGVIEGSFEKKEFLALAAAVFSEIDRPYIERIAAEKTPDEVEKEIASCVSRRLDLA